MDHGSSSGAVSLYVLPAGSDRPATPHPAWAVLCWLLLIGLFLLPALLGPVHSI